MSVWLSASVVLAGCFVGCAATALRRGTASAVAALNLASTIAVLALVTMTVAFDRQPFVDLAVVLAPLAVGGSFAFVRYLERRR